jgi:hypothetical protein
MYRMNAFVHLAFRDNFAIKGADGRRICMVTIIKEEENKVKLEFCENFKIFDEF